MAIRLVPLVRFAVWGSDWGEYFVITEGFVSGGAPPAEHFGWGSAYVDFPGFFYLAGSASLVLGVPAESALSLVMPCFTALSCLFVACIALRLGGGPWAALVSAGFLGFVFPEVFQNSHAVPGSVGSVLVLATMLMFIVGDSWRRDTGSDRPRPAWLYVLMLVLAVTLAATHHLSLYFAIIVVGLAHLLRSVMVRGKEPSREAWGIWSLLSLLACGTVFWLTLAPNFREKVMVDLLGMPGWVVLAIAWAGALALLALSHGLSVRGERTRNPGFSGPSVNVRLFMVFVLAGLVIGALVSAFGVPGTSITPSADLLVFIAPIIVIMAFMVGSTDMVIRNHSGHVAIAWIVAIVVSFLIAAGLQSRVLISYRHFPYIIEAAAVFIGVGVIHFRRTVMPEGRRWDATASGTVVVLVAILAVTAYPPKGIMGGFQEGTDEGELAASLWLQGGLPAPGAEPGEIGSGAVATDHRLSSMAFGLGGQMATWDYARRTLLSPLDESTRAELASVSTPAGDVPVTAVLLSSDLREGAALLQWEPAEGVTGEAWDKFWSPPFWRLYDGGDCWVFGVDHRMLSSTPT